MNCGVQDKRGHETIWEQDTKLAIACYLCQRSQLQMVLMCHGVRTDISNCDYVQCIL
jgi:hypothetical protein